MAGAVPAERGRGPTRGSAMHTHMVLCPCRMDLQRVRLHCDFSAGGGGS